MSDFSWRDPITGAFRGSPRQSEESPDGRLTAPEGRTATIAGHLQPSETAPSPYDTVGNMNYLQSTAESSLLRNGKVGLARDLNGGDTGFHNGFVLEENLEEVEVYNSTL